MSKVLIFLICVLSPSVLQGQEGAIFSAHYHESTHEVSIHIRLKSGIQTDENYQEELINSADSTIANEDFTIRKRLSSKAFYYFDTTGYSNLVYINESNELVGQLSFQRFEYQEDELDSFFKAVFSISAIAPHTSIKFHRDQYAITASLIPFLQDDFKSVSIDKDIQLSPSEESKLGFANGDILDGSVIEWGNFNTIYAISLGDYNQNTWDSKVITSSSPSVPLYNNHSQFVIFNAHALPLVINGLPVLFCNRGKPDTDWNWIEFMYFNGNEYIIARDGAISFSK